MPTTLALSSNAVIDTSAVQETASLTLSLTCQERTLTLTTLRVDLSLFCFRGPVTNITGLIQNWEVNLTLLGSAFPSSWSEPEPTTSQAGKRFEYFEVVINASTAGGSYDVHFNLSQATLGSVSPNNVRLFIFDTNWTALPTTVRSTDPALFFGVTTHFSKFLIGEKPTAAAPEAAPAAAAAPSGGGGRAVAPLLPIAAPPPVKVVIIPPLEISPPEVTKPLHIPSDFFDITVSIPSKYREVLPGEELIAEVHIVNIGRGLATTQLEYNIWDAQQHNFFREYEAKVVENEITFLKEVVVPPDLPLGEYLFIVILRHDDEAAIAGYPFAVISKLPKPLVVGKAFLQRAGKLIVSSSAYWLSALVLLLVFLGMLWLLRRKYWKK
ncbi:MAG: hypothetical protein Q8R53_06435 [Nanoarchaeota archaeon]|nr:hypothetical protein [Nanoarchaeota archaeon]